MPDSYRDIEYRIFNVLNAILSAETPNVAAFAREFDVPYRRLLERYKGRIRKYLLAG